jgi:hypothetical protein
MEIVTKTARLPPEDPEGTCTSGDGVAAALLRANSSQKREAYCFRTRSGFLRVLCFLLMVRFRGQECPRHMDRATQ